MFRHHLDKLSGLESTTTACSLFLFLRNYSKLGQEKVNVERRKRKSLDKEILFVTGNPCLVFLQPSQTVRPC